MRRRVLGSLAVAALLLLAGCNAGPLGPDAQNQEALAENASYDWHTTNATAPASPASEGTAANGTNATGVAGTVEGNATVPRVNATINVTGGSYKAVYNVNARTGGRGQDRPTFVVSDRGDLGREEPLSLSALKFRYPNGTVVGIGTNEVQNKQERTLIRVPQTNGQLAFSASADRKQLNTPTFVEGGYEVTLPAGMRVDYVPLARVNPRGYSTTRSDNRVTIHWKNVRSGSISVRYYLARDLLFFGGGVAVLVLVAIGGVFYYRRKISALVDRRREVGLDTENDDR